MPCCSKKYVKKTGYKLKKYGLFLSVCFNILVFFIFSGFSCAETVVVDENTSFISLGQHADVLEDREGAMSLADVLSDNVKKLWMNSPSENINFGYTESVFWVRTEIVNRSSKDLKFMIEIGYPPLDHIHAFVLRSQKNDEWVMGDKLPYHVRPIDDPGFVCPIFMSSGERVAFYARVQTTSSMQIPLHFYSPDGFLKEKQITMLFQGLYYGSMIIMVLYNFFLFLSVRESDYLYYVLYVFFQCLFLASFNGLSFKYFWPEATVWNDQAIVVSISAMILSGNLFAIRFMKLTKDNGKSYILFSFFAVAAFMNMIFATVIFYRMSVLLLMLLAVTNFIFGIPAVLTRWHKGFPPGRFFALAWLSLAGGAIILVLNKVGCVPRNFMTENATQIGSVVQVMLLSFALADRLNMEKKEKIEAQHQAHDEERNARIANEKALLNERLARETKEEAYLIQKKAAETLEQEVMARTGQLKETLAKVKDANQQIMSSLRYARMIQLAILPDPEKAKTWVPGLSIWWAPRDIVGGDFYFVDQIKGGFIVSVADCTGRGVAGAFMTIIAGSELKRIVKGEECHDPGEILARLNRRVRRALRQDTRRAMSDDGLNIGICVVNRDSRSLCFSGAKIDMLYGVDGEIHVLKGDRKSVGYASGDNLGYSVQSMALDKRVAVYIYTDGITDQLGERSGQRFGTRRLKDLLTEHSRLPISVQCEIVKASSEVYRGERDQVDDMTMVAFEVKI